MSGWSLLLLLLLLLSLVLSEAADPPPKQLYFNDTDVYHVTCWPIDVIVDTEDAKTEAGKLRNTGYEYLGTASTTTEDAECWNWLDAITERTDKYLEMDMKDQAFVDTGVPSKGISVEYYANHSQCRWLPLHSGEHIATTPPGDFADDVVPIPYKDPQKPGQKPASGPWCYVNEGLEGIPKPKRCLPYCGEKYEKERKRKTVPHKSIVAPLHINHNLGFTEQLGKAFDVSPRQKAKIYVKPSMVDHADELLEQKRYVFYGCCGVVGAVILWITACHFLGQRVKRRRLAIVAIQRQAISANITRRRRESQAEHEEEDAREQ